MNKLIIAEKPMLARDIARVMCGKSGKMPVRGNGFTVVSCAGHLLELADPADIKPEWAKWDLSLLPIYFKPWPKKISKGKNDLVKIIRNELKNCSGVINAGDPDDEGQLIVDEVLRFLKYNGPVERVYISDSLDKNIKKAFTKLKNNKDCEAVGYSAEARQIADFVFGINESRLAGLSLKEHVSVGRVQTPTLGLVVKRDREIENHTVRKFYELYTTYITESGDKVFLKFNGDKDFYGDENKVWKKEEFEKIIANLPQELFLDVEKSERREAAPLPYNLTKLQSDMNKRFGYSANETQTITQQLRDNFKAITYNRTDCQYLSEEHFKEAKSVCGQTLKNIKEQNSWNVKFLNKHKAFNDKNVSAHHAIIPQEISVDLNKMNEKQKNVYLAICYRYLSLFLDPAEYLILEGSTSINKGELTYKYEAIQKKGWKEKQGKAQEKENKYKNIVALNEGRNQLEFERYDIEEKETKPPKHYTEGSLIADMASISKYCKDEEIKQILKKKDENKKGENGGIGTTATRAEIIDKLKRRGFVKLQGKKLLSTEFGKEFFDLIPENIKTADVTAKWWLIQDDIAHGKSETYDLANNVVKSFNEHKNVAYKGKTLNTNTDVIIGRCPICGEGVVVKDKVCSCSSNKVEKRGNEWVDVAGCGFKMFRSVAGKKLTEKQIEKLLDGGEVEVSGLKSKTGKKFSANLKIKNPKGNNGFADIEFLFK